MKKLLATTAMCLVLATGLGGITNANEPFNLDASSLLQTSLQQNVLMAAANLYRGDFQKVSRSMLSKDLYAGDGAAQMMSIMMHRF